jgi:hypothetical protein
MHRKDESGTMRARRKYLFASDYSKIYGNREMGDLIIVASELATNSSLQTRVPGIKSIRD